MAECVKESEVVGVSDCKTKLKRMSDLPTDDNSVTRILYVKVK